MVRRARRAALLGVLVLAATGVGAQTPARLSAGAGRAEVAITPAMMPLDGFAVQYDPLHARVLVLDNGLRRVALVVVDLTSIGDDAVAEMKGIVGRTAGVDAANVWIVAGHSFSAPHMFGAHAPPGAPAGTPPSAADQQKATAYHAAMMDAVTRAATQAKAATRPARLGFGQGTASVNVNRNAPAADGWWLGADDSGPSDKGVEVVRIEGLDRRPLALLVDYAVQSSVMDHSVGQGGKGITADLGGAAMTYVERQYDGAVSLFLTGAAGDQAPAFAARRNVYDKDGHYKETDIGDAGYPLVQLQGERLGTEAVRVSERIAAGQDRPTLGTGSGTVPLGTQERPRNLQQIHPTRSYNFATTGQGQAPYFVMQIGDVALVGVQVELSAATGLEIKRRSPFAHTIVMTMVNGSAKYLPDADGYKKITYEAMNSSFVPGSAETLSNRILGDLATMHRAAAR